MPDGDRLVGPPPGYVEELAGHVRGLALGGRGEDVRGRNLVALHVLETSYAHGWMRYQPSRDVGRWLVMLLDLAGARAGLAPTARIERTLDAFLDDVRELGLRRLAEVTRTVTLGALARAFAWPELVLAPLLPAMSVSSVLWHLGFRLDAYRAQVHFEKHSQGKLIRRKIGGTLDELWAQAAKRELGDGRPRIEHVMAALPPALPVLLEQMEGALQRIDESLEGLPFAVFYALATDAARSGRRWEPPPPFVEGAAYSREDFERAVGRTLHGAHSRRSRYRRSVAFAELGLSGYFPCTVELVDGWLRGGCCSELWVEPPAEAHAGGDDGWLTLVRRRMEAIEDLQWRIYAAVSESLKPGSGGDG